MRQILGKDLKVGDTIEVWWRPRRDTITNLAPYTGPLAYLFKDGARLAEFAICQSGMTVENDRYFLAVGKDGDA